MSDPQTGVPRVPLAVVVSVTLIGLAIIAGIVGINLGVSDEGKAASTVQQLMGFGTLVVTSVLTLAGVKAVGDRVVEVRNTAQAVKEDTAKVLNGTMDEKIQRNVLAVLEKHTDINVTTPVSPDVPTNDEPDTPPLAPKRLPDLPA